MIWLTKSQFLSGHECARRAWLKSHHPEAANYSGGRRAEDGTNVGRIARRLFPSGSLAWGEGDSSDSAISETQRLIEDPQTTAIFEAAFYADGLFARVDILERVPDGWRIIEIKASGTMKTPHVADMAFQLHILRQCGLNVDECFLGLINKEYVWTEGEPDPNDFLILSNETRPVLKMLSKTTAQEAAQLLEVIQSEEGPAPARKSACRECDYHEHCWGEKLPDRDIIYLPYASEKTLAELEKKGCTDICSLPSDFKLNEKQSRTVRALCLESPIYDSELGDRLAQIQFEALYIDFEVDAPTIPWVEGMRPFGQIPFQFHGEWELEPGVLGQSVDHLWPITTEAPGDPREDFVSALLPLFRAAKSIVVYSEYEMHVVRSMRAMGIPGAEELAELGEAKVVDLLEIIRDTVRHPGFGGKYSIKKVLPTLCPHFADSYKALAVKNGDEVVDAFLRLRTGRLTEVERSNLAKEIIEYCTLDVVAMVEVMKSLRRTVAEFSS